MLVYLAIVQMVLIAWLLWRTPNHYLLDGTFVEVFDRLGKIESKLSAILYELETRTESELDPPATS